MQSSRSRLFQQPVKPGELRRVGAGAGDHQSSAGASLTTLSPPGARGVEELIDDPPAAGGALRQIGAKLDRHPAHGRVVE